MVSAESSLNGGVRVEVSNRIDPLLFLLAVIVGAGAIVLLKVGFITLPYANTLGILAPIVVMGLYVCTVTLLPRTRLRYDQAGDNLYYLGFTYTLVSLAVTLYRFHATEGFVDYIVSNFGIALVTTMIGVVARVCLHQMRDDPLELEREARFALSEAVARLRAEIDLAVREFNHFNRTLQQSAQEAIEAQGNVALEALDKSTKQYADVAVQAAGYLEGCFTEFNKQVAELNTNTAQITAALTALSTRIDAIEAPRDLLSQKLAPVFQRIAEAAEQTAGRASSERQRNQNVATLAARIEALAGSIEGIFDRVTDKEQQVTTAIQHAVTAAGHAAELTRQVGQWTERFTDIESKQAEIAQALVDASQAVQQRDAAVDESMRKAFADATAAMGQYGTRVQTMLQTHAESFEVELKHAESAFRSLSRVLTDGASLLANELGRRA
jgi:hypothetical protein